MWYGFELRRSESCCAAQGVESEIGSDPDDAVGSEGQGSGDRHPVELRAETERSDDAVSSRSGESHRDATSQKPERVERSGGTWTTKKFRN